MTNRYFVFEGVDGSGKSTQIAKVEAALQAKGYDVLSLREPGSTYLSEQIRKVLLDPENHMDPRAEVLLFSAARAQLISEVVKPALEAGKVVISDRSFWSTLAYQGYARKMNLEELYEISQFAVGHLEPEHVFLLDIDPQLAATRRETRSGEDRIESEGLEFQQKVRKGFLNLAHDNPNCFHVIDANKKTEEITCLIIEKMFESLRERQH